MPSKDHIKKMSELLRTGAVMLSATCPDCKVPLFKLRSGEIICPSCDRRVVFAADEQEAKRVVTEQTVISEAESVVLEKISDLTRLIKQSSSEESYLLAKQLLRWLSIAEKIKKIQELSGKGSQ